jgi:signal transduction histidine kinase
VRDESGQVLYYEGTVVDVTARKATEQSQSRQREELERRVQERTNQLALTNQALQAEVTERRRAEAAAAAASRAKSEFLANISHEIRTPMNAILGYAQILHRDPALRPSDRDAMETIVASGNHLIGLIEDILDLSKIEAGKVELLCEDFDLAAMVQSAAAMFRQRCKEKNLTLRLEVPGGGEAVWVRGDCRRLRQVIINLLANAVKFTDEGQVAVRVQSNRPGEYRFEISDTGIGIPRESLRAIFDPFLQAPAGMLRGGAGLGLAIARQLIELMGGDLAVASQPNVGSCFYFALGLDSPRNAVAASGASADLSSPRRRQAVSLAPGRTVRTLVVDDVPANRAVLSDLLGQIGCQVASAGSGEQALHMIETAEPDQLAELIFIDIMMPGLDGVATARRIRQCPGGDRLKLVATTAAAFSTERPAYLAAGFAELICKPIQCERV